MAITKLVITGNTTAVGISTTPITVSLEHKAESTSVAPVGNITATNVQAALEQLDNIKVQSSYGTLDNPTFTGTVTFPSAISITDKLGIGINTPLADLHINNVIGSELRIDTTGGTDANSLLNFRESGVDKASLYWDGVDDELYLETTAGDISLMAAGNVGIGNTNPATALDVTGVITTNGLTSSAGIDVTGTVTADSLTVDTNTLYVDSTNDRVGIGETNPADKLQVTGGAVRIKSTFPRIYLEDTDNNSDYSIINSQGAFSIYDDTNDLYRMQIDASGKVGIGTTTPASEVDIFKASGGDSALSLTSEGVQRHQIIQKGHLDGGLVFYNHTASAERMRIDTSGNVGIGTASPEAKLHVKNNDAGFEVDVDGQVTDGVRLLAYDRNTDTDRNIQYRANKHLFNIGSSERMRIDSSGNVGIGTTSPAQALSVSATNNSQQITFGRTGTSVGHGTIGADSTGAFGIWNSADAKLVSVLQEGNVGIGTASPAARLDIHDGTALGGTNNDWLLLSRIHSFTGNQTYLEIGNLRDSTGSTWQQAGTRIQSKIDSTFMGYMQFNGTGNEHGISFGVGASTASHSSIPEAMRIDSIGNLLVGRTSDDYSTQGISLRNSPPTNSSIAAFTRDGSNVASLNRLTNDGTLLTFFKDSAQIGSIGTVLEGSARYFYIGNNALNSGIGFYTTGIYPSNGLGGFSDNSKDLGSGTVRWDDVYATNGTIQTSDRNEKQDIRELLDAEQRVATACKGLLRAFKWNSAVEEKGDEARIHFGIIAQDLQDAFTAEGLDADDYAMFINSTWTDEETGEERSRMGVRYSELLAFIISAI